MEVLTKSIFHSTIAKYSEMEENIRQLDGIQKEINNCLFIILSD